MKVFIYLIGFISCSSSFPIKKNVNPKIVLGEYNNKFEGDIVLTEDQKKVLSGEIRNGLVDIQKRWLDKTVPYTFADGAFTVEQEIYISSAIQKISDGSCIKFKRLSDEVDYIEFVSGNTGCWSNVGRLGGRQQINLTPNVQEKGCFRNATIQHEMLHALGFYHMQSATDRDNYITIIWKNIKENAVHNFRKYDENIITHFGVPYDIGSVMHYGAYAFSKNELPTIIPIDITQINNLGQRIGLSDSDFKKLNIMYEC